MKRKPVVMALAMVMAASVWAMPATVLGQTETATDENPNKATDSTTTAVSEGQEEYKTVRLSWRYVAGAVGYNIYISSPEGKKDYELVDTIASDKRSYRLNNLNAEEESTFFVEAFYSVEDDKASHSVDTTVLEIKQSQYLRNGNSYDGEAPEIEDKELEAASGTLGAPDVDAYINTTTKVTVKWDKVEGASGYYVYKADDETGIYKKVKTAGKNTTSWRQTGLSKGSDHQYKVKAYKKVDEGNLIGKTGSDSAATPEKLTRSSEGFSKTNAAKILKKGATKVGKRYVFGASGPNSFDCSGFVYWTLKNSGVDDVAISRTSSKNMYKKYKQYSVGKSVSKAQPGDILLFSKNGKTGGIYHAGLYYGNNKTIHATTGRVNGVEIDTFSTSQLIAIIRMPGLR